MLQQRPTDRPTVDKILAMKQVQRHIPDDLKDVKNDADAPLLGTIRLPFGNMNKI